MVWPAAAQRQTPTPLLLSLPAYPLLALRGPQGLLSLANAKTDENDSHFSFMMGRATHLDGKMTVFGEVVSGLQVGGLGSLEWVWDLHTSQRFS